MNLPDTVIGRLRHWAAVSGDRPAVTFVDYSVDRDGTRQTVTWSALSALVESTAARLRHLAPGERVAVMAPQGLEYVVAFLGALSASTIAVPLFDPSLRGHDERLHAIVADCAPSAVLTTVDSAVAVEEFLASEPTRPVVLTVAMADRGQAGFTPPHISPEDVAYVQYTSGSTRTPAGVVLTHRTVMSNAEQVAGAFQVEPGRSRTVSWLPLFHDMGLMVGVLEPVFAGLHSIMLDPVAFIQRPVRWLQLLTEYPEALTAAPNFAFDYCVRRVRAEDRRNLQLDRILAMINGSEPIVPSVVENFSRAFIDHGLRPDACRPSYGLAEATVFVTTGPATSPRTTAFDRESLAAGCTVAVSADDAGAVQLVGCGVPFGQQVAIVDPDTAYVRTPGHVGEIWVHGPNVGSGYWGRPDRSNAVFAATLRGAPAGLPTDPWLRTGDLGVYHGGELYVTGRRKDLIIVDGRNHYPQDIEATVAGAHDVIRRGRVVAFSTPGTDTEKPVVIAEHDLLDGIARDDLVRLVRKTVSDRHGLALADVVFVPPGAIPRTTSGKLARSACRAAYLRGALPGAHQ